MLCLQQAPASVADGSSPWELASGLLYPEDILDESPYLFIEIPGRLTGSYSGYNVDPLFVIVSPFEAICHGSLCCCIILYRSDKLCKSIRKVCMSATDSNSNLLQVNTLQTKEAFIAGVENGLKPLNVAALKFVDQV